MNDWDLLALLPYFLLAATVILSLKTSRKVALLGVFATLVSGWISQRVQLTGVLWIGLAGALLETANRAERTLWRGVLLGLFLVLAVALFSHWLPGFENLLIMDKVRFAADSLPYSLYLNMDKTLVGILILIFFVSLSSSSISSSQWQISLKAIGLLLAVLLPVVFLTHFVRFDPKCPLGSLAWMLNNFLFVCLAEEALFRGFIQGGLQRLYPSGHLPWLVASVAFGLAHYKGGFTYMALATLAGLFYGFVYKKTGRIELSMLTHFSLNAVHFFLFSYPALQ